MPSPERMTLVELLARTDALFHPMRGPFQQSFAQVRNERQRAFRTIGLPLGGSGADAARKRHERTLTTLESAGLVTFALDRRGQRAGVKLSPLGDSCGRRLTGCTTLADGWPLFVAMGELCGRAKTALLPEPLFCGNHDWSGTDEEVAELQLLQYDMLAFLSAGYVRASCDSDGKTWYGITSAGRAALRAGCPQSPPAEITFDVELSDLYDQALPVAERELRDSKAASPGNVVLPMPCGIGWGGCFSDWFRPGKAPAGSTSFAEVTGR